MVSTSEKSSISDLFFELADTPMLLLNPDFQVIETNPCFADLLATDPENIRGNSFFSLLDHRCAALFRESLNTLGHDDSTTQVNVNLQISGKHPLLPARVSIKKHKDLFFLTVYGSNPEKPLHEPTDHPFIQQDKELNSLLSQPALARKIVEKVPGLFYVYDLDTQQNIYTNQEIYNFLGYAEDEVEAMGSDFLKLIIHPDDYSWFASERKQALQQLAPNDSLEVEYRLLNANNEWRFVRSKEAVFSYGPSGEVKQVIGIASDISARKNAFRKVEKLNNINSTLLHCASRLLNAGSSRMDQEINHTISELAGVLGYENISVFLFNEASQQARLNYEFAAEQQHRLPEQAYCFPYAAVRWWIDTLKQNELIISNDPHTLPDDIENVRTLILEMGIRSFVTVPILQQSQLIGYINFCHFSQPVETSEEIATQLTLLGNILANTLKRIETGNKLQHSRDDYKMLAENITDMVSLHGEDGTCYYATPSVEKVTGFTKDEYQGIQALELFHPEDVTIGIENIGRVLEGKQVQFQYRLWNKNFGQYRWAETTGKAIEHHQTGRKNILAVTRSIHELKQKEEEIKSSEAYLRAVLNSGNRGIYAFDTESRLIFANDFHLAVIKQITGVKPQVGQKINAYLPEYLQTLQKEHVNRVLNGEIFTAEARIVQANGAVHWGEYYYSPVIIDEQVQGGVVIARDITQQKLDQQEIKDTRDRLDMATSLAGIGIWEIELAGNQVYWDDTMRHMFGVQQSEEITGDTWQKCIHPDDLERVMATLTQAVTEKSSLETEFRIRKKDTEETRHIRSFARVVVDENNEALSVIGANYDLTDIRKAEQELITTNNNLKKTNTELDQFVYSTSHNLRAPLTSILGLLELFKNGEVDDSKQYIRLIEKSIYKLDETIHEIIEYSRNNRVEIAVEPVDFELIANDVLESLSFMEQAKNMDIQVQVDQPVPFYSDFSRLRVIFHNLISNGIKYCDLNKPERYLHISVTSNSRKAIIKIKDNGIGIDGDDLEKVFSMFYRATQQASGSGLGLYILKEAVMKLNGVVNASGQLGKGVTFIIQVPNLQQ